ncbi:AcrR family transcriptional regulator [Kitasatospora sp. MAP12-15]|uniref:TetR/AcrR family transcriptional regulator n=1 Tax=unclassified Kitasatospora TaxID=2633591 RepID=UPI0024739522|nr:TetR/AcrR family transcriptional regulator [Kitasatospora sp. MAP12-44]MDH6108709.1 AcrR family transcriptional regulator [Kitasatospora sp. MAP12-44]
MTDTPRDPSASIWVAPPKGRKRGSAPAGLSRERVIRAAVALMDAEGLPAFSMRKLAAELDVTPMSVYWYVDTKDALLELALDEVVGEIRIPPLEDHGDWRRHLRTLAHEYRHCFQRHPWAGQLVGQFLAIGPNSMLFSTSAVAAATRSGLTGDQLGGALGLIFQFVYGFALVEAQWSLRVRVSGLGEDEFQRAVFGIAEQADPRFVENTDLVAQQLEGGVAKARDRQFEVGLDIAMAGIDATLAQSQSQSQSQSPA